MTQEGASVKEIETMFDFEYGRGMCLFHNEETQTTTMKKEKHNKQDRAKMMCRTKCGNYGHYDKRDIDFPLNAINIRNVWAVKSTIKSVPGSQKVYMGPKAKAMEEQEWKILAITKYSANKKCAANNNNKNKTNNVKYSIDGVQVTMIASSVNNGEEE
eukprot:15365412-Ditylum_brightwellii.AAC.2